MDCRRKVFRVMSCLYYLLKALFSLPCVGVLLCPGLEFNQEVGTPLASQYLVETHQLGSIESSPYSFE